jgi:predicted ATPase
MLADVESRVSSPVLVGRSDQLSALDAALAETDRGLPQAVVVGGEAGVGKSRLVAEFADRARGSGARALIGGCLELGAGRTGGPALGRAGFPKPGWRESRDAPSRIPGDRPIRAAVP